MGYEKINEFAKDLLFVAGKEFCQRGSTDKTMNERKTIIDAYNRTRRKSYLNHVLQTFKINNAIGPVDKKDSKTCEESLKEAASTMRRNAVTEMSIEERTGLGFYLSQEVVRKVLENLSLLWVHWIIDEVIGRCSKKTLTRKSWKCLRKLVLSKICQKTDTRKYIL